MTSSFNSIANNSDKNYHYWTEQIKLKQASGLSRSEYCRVHGLIYSMFSYWETKLQSTSQEPSQLVPVKLNSGEPIFRSMNTKCTLIFKGGHELKVHDQTILPMLISLLK